ncbi:MAG TPA: hypothetical protein VG602_10685 [Actinomycetota bacterium]|nr:hypothetical protein [Actinomycetota bacterium]
MARARGDQANVLALLSLGAGFLSVIIVVLVSIVIGRILAIAGLVLGLGGLVFARNRGGGRTLAITGMVLSAISIALLLIFG